MYIDASLAYYPYTNLLGPLSSTHVDVEPLCIRKTIYIPATFVRIFLERDLTPAEACTCLCNAIIDGAQEVGYCPIINWICVALTMKVVDDKSPLAMPQHTAPLSDGELLRN